MLVYNKKMKCIFTIIFVVSLFSCVDKEENENKRENDSGVFFPEVESRSVIIGYVKNIEEYPKESKTIRLSVDDISAAKQVKYITTIDEKGKFLFDIPLGHSINTYLGYSDGRITPYIFPNDTLIINCKIKKVGKLTDINVISYDEKHSKFQKEFSSQYRWVFNQINNFKKNLSKKSEIKALKLEYLKFNSLLNKKIKYRAKINKLNDTINDYLNYTVAYSCYKDIIKLGKDIKSVEEKEQFYSFLAKAIVFNKKALITPSYRIFLNYYMFYVEPKITERVLSSGKTRAQVKKELIAQIIKNIQGLRTGIWKDYLIASIVRNRVLDKEETTVSLIGYCIELAQENIKSIYTQQLLIAMLNKEKRSIIEQDNVDVSFDIALENFSSISESKLFAEILEKNKGKVIYMDFWGTWCRPCIEQFPYAKELHSKFDAKDVSFVFLCCKSNEEVAKKIIKKYQLKGQHYLLNQKQYEYFEKKFNIIGLPSYALIDKNGKVFSKNAPRPAFENTSIVINKLLKVNE